MSRRGRALFRNGSWTPWNYFHRQTRASQIPLSELQEPEHFSHRVAEGWRFAVSGKTLHEEELAHDTGTQFGIHHLCDGDQLFLQCCSPESIEWWFFFLNYSCHLFFLAGQSCPEAAKSYWTVSLWSKQVLPWTFVLFQPLLLSGAFTFSRFLNRKVFCEW